MYILQLTEILENILVKYDNLFDVETKNNLVKTIESRKYDLQDQALIEAIINDKEQQLIKSLNENYQKMINEFAGKYGSVLNTDPNKLNDEIISIFISNLEYYIDYFYNSLLNKHFSSG